MSILLIGGSPSVSSRSGRLLEEIGIRLEQEGLAVDRLHVRELPAQALLHADFKHPEIVAALRRVENASGIVIGTPVYKAAYSGVLKSFIDLLPQFGLRGKVVLPLACGGSAAHTLILDYALRPVLASLAPKQVLESIYAVEQQIVWSESGGLTLDPSIEQRVQLGVASLLDALQPSWNVVQQHTERHSLTA